MLYFLPSTSWFSPSLMLQFHLLSVFSSMVSLLLLLPVTGVCSCFFFFWHMDNTGTWQKAGIWSSVFSLWLGARPLSSECPWRCPCLKMKILQHHKHTSSFITGCTLMPLSVKRPLMSVRLPVRRIVSSGFITSEAGVIFRSSWA